MFNGTQPVIVEEPEDIVTDILTPVNITCKANGEPDPIYSWFKVRFVAILHKLYMHHALANQPNIFFGLAITI